MDTIDPANPARRQNCGWPTCLEDDENCRAGYCHASAPFTSIHLTGERLEQERLAMMAGQNKDSALSIMIACAVMFASGFIVCAIGFGGGWRPW